MDQNLYNSPVWYQDWADVSLKKGLDCLTTWSFPTGPQGDQDFVLLTTALWRK